MGVLKPRKMFWTPRHVSRIWRFWRHIHFFPVASTESASMEGAVALASSAPNISKLWKGQSRIHLHYFTLHFHHRRPPRGNMLST